MAPTRRTTRSSGQLQAPPPLSSKPSQARLLGDDSKEAKALAAITDNLSASSHDGALSILPPADTKTLYFNERGHPDFKFDGRFDPPRPLKKSSSPERLHPKVREARQRGVLNERLKAYWLNVDPTVNVPLAGFSKDGVGLEPGARAGGDGGVKKVRRAVGAGARRAAAKKQPEPEVEPEVQPEVQSPPVRISPKTPFDIHTFPLSRHSSMTLRSQSPISLGPPSLSNYFSPDGPCFGGNHDADSAFQEDTFHSRPSVKIPVPDHLKSLLVDDWENVTKNQQLVPLPHKQPVTKILEDYLAYERPKHVEGSPSLEILEETIAGLLEYFDKCLGRILLYR